MRGTDGPTGAVATAKNVSDQDSGNTHMCNLLLVAKWLPANQRNALCRYMSRFETSGPWRVCIVTPKPHFVTEKRSNDTRLKQKTPGRMNSHKSSARIKQFTLLFCDRGIRHQNSNKN